MHLLSTWMGELAKILFGVGICESTIVQWLGGLFLSGFLFVATEFEPVCVHYSQTLQFLSSTTSKLPSHTFGDYVHIQFLHREQGSLMRSEGGNVPSAQMGTAARPFWHIQLSTPNKKMGDCP